MIDHSGFKVSDFGASKRSTNVRWRRWVMDRRRSAGRARHDDVGCPKMFRHIGRVDDARNYWEGK
ncbi:MAG: hypothetical protein ABIO38_05850 [Luteimonas sp.]